MQHPIAVELCHDVIKFDIGMNVITAKDAHTRQELLGLVSNGMKTDATVSGIFMLDGQPKCGQPCLHQLVIPYFTC